MSLAAPLFFPGAKIQTSASWKHQLDRRVDTSMRDETKQMTVSAHPKTSAGSTHSSSPLSSSVGTSSPSICTKNQPCMFRMESHSTRDGLQPPGARPGHSYTSLPSRLVPCDGGADPHKKHLGKNTYLYLLKDITLSSFKSRC